LLQGFLQFQFGQGQAKVLGHFDPKVLAGIPALSLLGGQLEVKHPHAGPVGHHRNADIGRLTLRDMPAAEPALDFRTPVHPPSPDCPAVRRGKDLFGRRILPPEGRSLERTGRLSENEQGPRILREQQSAEGLEPRVGLLGGVAALEKIAHLSEEIDLRVAVFQLLAPEEQPLVGLLEFGCFFGDRGLKLLPLGDVKNQSAALVSG
jgi:hypothetical protein